MGFMQYASEQPHPCVVGAQLAPGPEREALVESLERDEDELRRWRDAQLDKLEQCGAELWRSGAVRDWIAGVDLDTKAVAGRVNGPLLMQLALETSWSDPGAVLLFRDGAPVVGTLPQGGLPAKEFPEAMSVDELMATAEVRNRAVISNLRRDPHVSLLRRDVQVDARCRRMTDIVAVDQLDLSNVIVGSKFSREQGFKDDGSVKTRSIYNGTEAGNNLCVQPQGALSCDRIDQLLSLVDATAAAVEVRLETLAGTVEAAAEHTLELWKADIDAAFRRIPVVASQRHLLWEVWLEDCGPVAARHNVLPFGCTGSVYAWDRIGALIAHLARVLLKLPVLRYVDDFFSVARSGGGRHAMRAFARLVRLLLGSDAICDKKLEYGNPHKILGVCVELARRYARCWPSGDKVAEWMYTISGALSTGMLSAGDAGKLAGRLSWAASYLFRRMGRAMLRPLFHHSVAPLPRGRVRPELMCALRWWYVVLSERIMQTVPINQPLPPVCELFCDARGSPPRVAAVLCRTGCRMLYTDAEPGAGVLSCFTQRSDNQIMGLELLAISVALKTFRQELRGTTVRIWSDNVGAEMAVGRGSAARSDHNGIVHGIWLEAWRLQVGLWIERVPSKDNVADLPSREQYRLLRQLRALWRPSVFPTTYDGLSLASPAEELMVAIAA